jgi:hypothetical protein
LLLTPKKQLTPFVRLYLYNKKSGNAFKNAGMKTFVAGIFFLMLLTGLKAQEYIGSTVDFTKIRADSVITTAKGSGTINLSQETNEFIINIPLAPILVSSYANDSINKVSSLLYMHYKSVFPENTLVLDNIVRDRRTYKMLGEISINGIRRPLIISIDLYKPLSQAPVNITDPPDVPGAYPVHISFMIEINPAEFNMDYETAKFTQTILVQVDYGTINRIAR